MIRNLWMGTGKSRDHPLILLQAHWAVQMEIHMCMCVCMCVCVNWCSHSVWETSGSDCGFLCLVIISTGPTWQILIWTMRDQTLKLSSVWWLETMQLERPALSVPGLAMPHWPSTSYLLHTCPQSGQLISTESAKRWVWKMWTSNRSLASFFFLRNVKTVH